MAWVKLDDGFPENPKVSGLSDRAFRFHVTALCHSGRHLTNGVISTKSGSKLAQLLELRRWKPIVTELVNARLWNETDTGWVIKDYLVYNLGKDEVEAKRAENRERQRRFRLKTKDEDNAVTNALGNDVTSQRDVTAPRKKRSKPPAEPLGVVGGFTGSEDTAAADSARNAPPPPIEQFDLNGWTDALRWVENDGWRLDSPQLAHRLVKDFGCNDPDALEHLVRTGRERRDEEDVF